MAETENQAFSPNKQKFRDNFAAKYPDIDMNDEEAYYGALNDENEQNTQKLQSYEESDKKLSAAFDADPRTAGLYLELVKQGGKPLEYLIDHYGSDFVELINDPDNSEFRDRLAKKRQEEIKRIADNKKLEEEAAQNLDATLDALAEIGQEMNLTDEQIGDAFNKFMQFTEDLIRDKVSKDWWRIIIKGITHDSDVEQARMEGEINGKNSKIKEKLKREKSSALNTSGGGQSTSGRMPKGLGGALDEETTPWYK